MPRSFYSLHQVFAPTRVDDNWRGPVYPGHGQRRITPTGLKQRLKRYLAERPEGFPQEAHAWGNGLKDLVDHALPDRLSVVLAFDPPAVMWTVAFIAGQDWGKPRSKAAPLLHHLLALPAVQRRATGARPLDGSDSREVGQRIAEVVGQGLAHTLDPLPGSPEAWAEVFGHWLEQGSPMHLGWVGEVLQRRPELVYVRAVDVAASPEWGPLSLERFPVLLTQGPGTDADRWNRWQAWGADPHALAGPSTVPGEAPLPRAFASLAPEGDTVGFVLAWAGVQAAQGWLQQHNPDLARHLPDLDFHRTMETLQLDSFDPRMGLLEALVNAPDQVLHAVPSPLWTAVRTRLGLMVVSNKAWATTWIR